MRLKSWNNHETTIIKHLTNWENWIWQKRLKFRKGSTGVKNENIEIRGRAEKNKERIRRLDKKDQNVIRINIYEIEINWRREIEDEQKDIKIQKTNDSVTKINSKQYFIVSKKIEIIEKKTNGKNIIIRKITKRTEIKDPHENLINSIIKS